MKQKEIFFFLIPLLLLWPSYAKAFDCPGSQQTGKLLKRWEYQTTLPASWETFMQDKK